MSITSRRAMMRSAAVGIAALGIGRVAPSVFARAIPSASPVTTGFAHEGILIPVGAIPNEGARLALMEPDAFNAGHIPGSRALTWEQLAIADSADAALAAWREDALATLADLGVARGTPILAYDDGTLFAARIWWVLTYLGFDPPQVLDGGLDAWKATGGEIERAIRATAPIRPV
ncbi:MAG: rhodanese-like domain-containing protein [Thermomicrobiales bacterium]